MTHSRSPSRRARLAMTECAISSTAVWPLSLRLAHWVSAVLVLAGLGLGTVMVQFVHNPALRFELTQTHKSIGIAILALTVLRLCRRLFGRAPKTRARGTVLIARGQGNTYSALRAIGAAACLRLVNGNYHARARADRGFRLIRVTISHGTDSGDLSHRTHRPCNACDPPIRAHRVALFGRHGPRIGLARPDTCEHVEGP